METRPYDVGRSTERILVATSIPLINIGLERILKERGFDICGVTEDYQEALQLFSQTKPSVVMVDYSSRRGRQIDQFSDFKRIAEGNQLYIGPMVFSENPNPLEAILCVQQGARAYLPTYAPREIVIQAVYTVLSKNLYIFSDIAEAVRERINKGFEVASGESDPISQLTPRQIEIFALLGKGLMHKEIAANLGISKKTVDSHVGVVAKVFDMSWRELKQHAIIYFATANKGNQEH